MKSRIVPALFAAFAFLGLAVPSQAQQFSQVIVFGDSLSDAGYFRPVLGAAGVPPALLASLGRFTTAPGPVWAELVAAHYGAPTGPSNVNNGTIFAQGGARVVLNNPEDTPPGAAERPISTQVTEYLTRAGGKADPNALYAVWAGANDVFQILPQIATGAITSAQGAAAIQAAATAEIQQIARLRAAGARYIVVFNLPNMGATPDLVAAGPAASAGATQLAAGFNLTLFAGLAQNNIRVIPVDSFALLTEVSANPSRYGFTNVTGRACGPFPPFSSSPDAFFCPPNVWVAPNANQTYLYADGVHPSSAAQAMIAQFVEQLISGPHQYSLLAEVPLHSRQGHLRALNDGLTLGRRNTGAERWNVFASIDHGEFEIDAGPGVQGLDNRGNSGTIGITTNISEAATLGIAVGQSKSRNQFAAGIGNFNTNDKVLSLFGSLRMGGFWGTAAASVSELTYGEIRRVVTLGPATRTTSANTDGSNVSGQIFAGYDFGWRGFSFGPVVGVTMQNVEINGFDEAEIGASATTSIMLRMAGQTRKSEVWSLGGRASLRLGAWTPWVRGTYDKERRDDVRVVTATPMTLATGNSYDIPAYMPDTSYTTLSAGIRGQIDRFGISAAYTTVQSRSGIRDDGATLLISYRF